MEKSVNGYLDMISSSSKKIAKTVPNPIQSAKVTKKKKKKKKGETKEKKKKKKVRTFLFHVHCWLSDNMPHNI